jgi:hypothetical protein
MIIQTLVQVIIMGIVILKVNIEFVLPYYTNRMTVIVIVFERLTASSQFVPMHEPEVWGKLY